MLLLYYCRIIHEDGFSKEERLSYRHLVWSNTIHSMLHIMQAMDRMQMKFDDPDREASIIIYLTTD